MTEQTPQLGVEAVLLDQQFQQSYKRVEQSLKNMEKHTKQLADASVKSSERKATAVKSSSNRQIASLIRLRRQMITVMFYTQLLSQAVVGAYNEMAEGAENAAERAGGRALAREAEVNLGPIVRQLVDVSNGAISAQEAFKVANAGILEDQGRFSEQYSELWEAARVAAVTGGGDAIDIFSSLLQSMREGTGEAADSTTKIFNLKASLQEYAAAMGTTADQLTHGEAAQAQFAAIVERTNELLAAGADEALAAVEPYKQLESTWEDFKNVLTVTAQDTGVLGLVSKAIRTLTEEVVVFGSAFTTIVGGLVEAGSPGKGVQSLFSDLLMGGAQFEERLAENQKRALEALGYFEDDVDPTQREYKESYEIEPPNIEPITKQLIKREELFEKHAENLEKIQRKYEQRLADIELNYTNEVARIQRSAMRSRESALRSHTMRVEDATIKHLSKIADLQEKYELKVFQKTRKFQIEQLQNERMYQYERSLLVAEGDVLGIEDLDARYALEKQKDEENFQDTMTADDETHQQRMAREEEMFGERIAQLIRHYEAQLEEIRIREQDQLDEAERKRQENRDKAQQDMEQQLEDEQARHEKSLEQWNQYWNQVAKQAKIGFEQVSAIIEEFFGPTGEAQGILDDFIERFNLRSDIEARVLPIVGTGSSGYDTMPWEDIPVGHQFGGSGMVSSPTLFRAGEGNLPERYSFEPMTTIGSSMQVSWGGGAIPIEGSGSLSGADLSGVGDAIAQGILIQLTGAMQSG